MPVKHSFSTNLPPDKEQPMFAKQVGFQIIKSYQIHQLLLALGSNHEADIHLSHARQALSHYGEVICSEAYINADYTANTDTPRPMYTNQCMVLTLADRMSLEAFVKVIKHIERECGRVDKALSGKKTAIVSLDIDVLAVTTLESKDEWLTIAERHPFKAHEWVGVEALLLQ